MSERRFLGIDLPHVPERFEPERSIGYARLSDNEKFFADQLSILDQRSKLALDMGKTGMSISIVVGKILGIAILACMLALLLLEGPRIHRMWSEWLGVRSESQQQ
jgi:hypothetical protein